MTQPADNLLTNPEFATLREGNRSFPHYAAAWQGSPKDCLQTGVPIPDCDSEWAVTIAPGGTISQFITLTDIPQVTKGSQLIFAVSGQQSAPGALEAKLLLKGLESEGGTWVPAEISPGDDTRTFFRHGRGELIVIAETIIQSSAESGAFRVATPPLTVDWFFENVKDVQRSDFRNVVGVEVQITNRSDQPVTIWHPTLKSAADGDSSYSAGRPLPDYYRGIPRTIAKLLAGEPIHILLMGSSIDRGSANPRNYLYQEDPAKPGYKLPVANDKPFNGELVDRPELTPYIGWFQHYFMYTGRLRLALMDKFDLPIENILLNVLAKDGSSIGESHCALFEYTHFRNPPDPNTNGHASGGSWEQLHPALFENGKLPAPDLVVFGSGHNARIDKNDEAAVFEGAIRWFQRYYPDTEFIVAMWLRNKNDELVESMPMLAAHYGIPFIDIHSMIEGLQQSTNMFALMPDGGHPQASAHYLWFKQLEKAFDIVSPLDSPQPQRLLPPRWNQFSYLWEGDMRTITAPSPRIVNNEAFIAAEGPIVIWASHTEGEDNKNMQLRINGEIANDAGRGRNYPERESRNASLLRGRFEPGHRYVMEIVGNNPTIHAFDEKLAINSTHIPAGDPQWKSPVTAKPFTSAWGAPYGDTCYKLTAGQSISTSAIGDCIAIDWADNPSGGTFEVWVDGELKWTQPTNEPFTDRHGNPHWIENRRPVSHLQYGPHTVEIRTTSDNVTILGVRFYRINMP